MYSNNCPIREQYTNYRDTETTIRIVLSSLNTSRHIEISQFIAHSGTTRKMFQAMFNVPVFCSMSLKVCNIIEIAQQGYNMVCPFEFDLL